MIRRPPRSTRTDTLFPYTTRFRSLQLLAGQFCKPSFDLIDPGRRSRCEVSMPMRAACEPGLDLWRLVGRIVVHHEVDVWPLGDRGVDPLEEVEELGCPLALVAFPDHGAGGNVERGDPGCRSLADVGLGDRESG